MLRQWLIPLLALVPLADLPACSCSQGFDPCASHRFYQESTVAVFLAEVLEGTGDQRYNRDQPPARVRVLETFAGLEPSQSELLVNPSLGTSCQFRLRAGEQWLIIGSKKSDVLTGTSHADIYTSGCSSSFPIAHFPKLFSALRTSFTKGQESIAGKARVSKGRFQAGRAAAALRITATDGEAVHHASANADGEFEFVDVSPGTWTLSVADQDYVLESIWPAKEIEIPAGGCAYRQVAVYPNGQIEGVVTDASGLAVEGVPVQAFIRDLRDEFASNPLRESITDANGAYRLRGLPEGEVIIAVNGNLYKDTHARPPVFYPGVTTREAANPVLLTEGGIRSDVNFTVQPPRRPTRIAADATLEDGSRPERVYFQMTDPLGRTRASASWDLSQPNPALPLVIPAFAGQQYHLTARATIHSKESNTHQNYSAELLIDAGTDEEYRVHLVLRETER